MLLGFSELQQHQQQHQCRVLNLSFEVKCVVIQKTQTHDKTSPESIQGYNVLYNTIT